MSGADYEKQRILALKRFGILDTPPDAIFDGITLAIANICEVPIALFTLVDSHRQWFKSAYGLKIRQTSRDIAFCHHAIAEPDKMLIVEDAGTDSRFCDNPLVTADPNIRFYAGQPVVTSDGYALGTLCVIDQKSRALKPFQRHALSALSSTVSAILEEWLRLQRVVTDRDAVELVLNQYAERHQHLYEDAQSMVRGMLNLLPEASVVINPQATIVSMNEAWPEFSTATGWQTNATGDDYLGQFANLKTLSSESKREVSDGIRSVLAGKIDQFKMKLPSASGSWVLEAQPLTLTQGGAGALLKHYFSAIH